MTKQDFIKSALENGLDQELFPGCGIGFSSPEETITEYSNSLIPRTDIFYTDETLFDIASLTKPIIALAILKLIDQGRFELETHVDNHIPVSGKGWEDVTIQHLLTSSLELDISIKLHELTPADAKKVILEADVKWLGNNYYYHNSTTIVLGWILESFYNTPLKYIIRDYVLKPAGMTSTFFASQIARNGHIITRVAPSEECPQRGLLLGKPHDELAYMFYHADPTIDVGCAGIFSTVPDMIKFGKYASGPAFKNKEAILSKMMINYLQPYGRTFGLGFDFPADNYVCPCFAKSTWVHTGFTGCALWIQPDHERVLVILSNATYPTRGTRGSASPLSDFRKKIARELFYCKHCME